MDSYLVQAARARATGANVHEVYGLCQLLILTSKLAEGGDEKYAAQAEEIRGILHALIKSGRMPDLPSELKWEVG